MEVILKQDIPGLGYKSDLITVKNGYARNYLIPKGLAVLATESSKKVLAEDKKQKAHKEEKILKEAEELAKGLEALKIKIAAKAGTSGKIFGSVNEIQIANAIKEQHKFDIDRKDISVDGESIKELGEYIAKIRLHKDVVVDLKFEVYAE
ncbi:MAG: 50S ribosomal protein L9 [Bacteroidetes bacterium]|nr:MAG: 50S ribosomal protein L9 [Bacteroidota bacterium]RLD76930.1 MAG: 50S ribosomal protein L9 [Bacteroidota bacterium]